MHVPPIFGLFRFNIVFGEWRRNLHHQQMKWVRSASGDGISIFFKGTEVLLASGDSLSTRIRRSPSILSFCTSSFSSTFTKCRKRLVTRIFVPPFCNYKCTNNYQYTSSVSLKLYDINFISSIAKIHCFKIFSMSAYIFILELVDIIYPLYHFMLFY